MQLNPKGKDTGRVLRIARVGFLICSLRPVRDPTEHTFPTATNVQHHTCDVSTQGCMLKMWWSRCLIAGWSCRKSPDSTNKQVFHTHTLCFTQSGHSEEPFSLGKFESQARWCQRSTLPAGFSSYSNLRFAMSTQVNFRTFIFLDE